jgi:hypothetical protein
MHPIGTCDEGRDERGNKEGKRKKEGEKQSV